MVWSAEVVSRYWDFLAATLPDDDYFSRRYGGSIIRWVDRHGVALAGRRVLDYGCGPGYFLEALARRAAPALLVGTDTSSESRARARRRLSALSCPFEVCEPVEAPTLGPFDVGFLVEVAEHLDDAALDQTLENLSKLLAPDGVLVVTTPNEEDLERELLHCPECGCVYHRWQHVRAWSAPALVAALERRGFQTLHCGSTALEPRRSGTLDLLRAAVRAVVRAPRQPHLLWIGKQRRP